MKKILLAITTSAVVALMPFQVNAGESDTCKGCHNGTVAPGIETLKGKFVTADELVAGAKKSKNDMMKPIQANEAKLKAAAAEIFK